MIQDETTISFIIDKVKTADMKLSEKTKCNLLKTRRTQDTNNSTINWHLLAKVDRPQNLNIFSIFFLFSSQVLYKAD